MKNVIYLCHLFDLAGFISFSKGGMLCSVQIAEKKCLNKRLRVPVAGFLRGPRRIIAVNAVLRPGVNRLFVLNAGQAWGAELSGKNQKCSQVCSR